jgi:hypothetical protein
MAARKAHYLGKLGYRRLRPRPCGCGEAASFSIDGGRVSAALRWAGWRLTRVLPTKSPVQIVEAEPAGRNGCKPRSSDLWRAVGRDQ